MVDGEYPQQLIFSLEKAEYLLNYATAPGEGGDKQKFWREIMGFESAEALRATILSQVSVNSLQRQKKDSYGQRYACSILLAGVSAASWQVRTQWIVLADENIARFITAYPERHGRQQ